MKKKISLVSMCLVSALVFSAPAFAGVPTEADDIRTGDDLGAACTALAEHDVSDQGKLAAKACSDFLGTMVQKVYAATAAGAPTQFSRIGPKQDQIACFRLPQKLSFVEFANLLLTYRRSHPDLADRPAFETGAWTLASNFPCVNYDPATPRKP